MRKTNQFYPEYTPSNEWRKMKEEHRLRANPPKAYILVGIAGSGKTTYALWRFGRRRIERLSFDDIRFKLLKSEETGIYFKEELEPKVRRAFFSKLTRITRDKKDFYVDFTGRTRKYRENIIMKIPKFYKVEIIVFPLNLEFSLRNNKKRARSIKEEIIIKQYKSFEPIDMVSEMRKYNDHFNEPIRIQFLTPSYFEYLEKVGALEKVRKRYGKKANGF